MLHYRCTELYSLKNVSCFPGCYTLGFMLFWSLPSSPVSMLKSCSTFEDYLNCHLCMKGVLIHQTWVISVVLCTTVYELYLGHVSYIPDPWKQDKCLIQNSIPYSFCITSCVTLCSESICKLNGLTQQIFYLHICCSVIILERKVESTSRFKVISWSFSVLCLFNKIK